MADPTVMIASDGDMQNGKGHPRGAGTFSRVLGHYVREQRALTLMDALRKMSLLPAQRLGRSVEGPAADGCGRGHHGLRSGARHRSSDVRRSGQYSEGIPFVIVNGVFVVKDEKLQTDVAPGRALRR